MQNKTAIVVDSGSDVPQEYIDKYPIFVLPLKVIYRDREYLDRINITSQDVYDRLTTEIPHTSLPSGEDIERAYETIQTQGFQNVIVITISSGLSGTFNQVRLIAKDYPSLNFFFVDTLNISIGAGFQAISATRMLDEGLEANEIYQKIMDSVPKTKVFFCVSTLEYLMKGGRIGKVTALLGSILHIKPIISCNKEGIYYTVSKVRGQTQAIAETINLAKNEAAKNLRYAVAIAQGAAKEEAARIMQEMKKLLPSCEFFVSTNVSPALAVHTGPGLIGIAVHALP